MQHLVLSEKDKGKYERQLNDRLQNLRPDLKSEKQAADEVLEKISAEIQSIGQPFNSAHFQMGGSMEKDTMVSSRNEIDIILSISQDYYEFPAKEDTRLWMKEQISMYYGIEDEYPNRHNVILNIHGYDVDILPTFQIEIKQFLNLSSDQNKIYKPYMSLLHVEFIQSRGKKFQDFCRLVKYWAHGPIHKTDNQKMASSFFLELVAADVFDRGKTWSLMQLFEAYLRRMKNIRKRRKKRAKFVGFKLYYNPIAYRTTPSILTVLDPCDPTDNIALKPQQANRLQELVRRARDTLKLWDNTGFGEVFKNYFSKTPV